MEGEVELQQQDWRQQEREECDQWQQQRQLELAHCEPSRSNASFAGLRFAGCEGVDGHVLVLCRSRPDELTTRPAQTARQIRSEPPWSA